MNKLAESHARTRAVFAGVDMAVANTNAPTPIASNAICANPASAAAATSIARLAAASQSSRRDNNPSAGQPRTMALPKHDAKISTQNEKPPQNHKASKYDKIIVAKLAKASPTGSTYKSKDFVCCGK